MPSDFGVFAPVFESAHGYLALLHLSGDDASAAVRLVRDWASSPSSHGDISQLLGDLNWRPTLVAAVASFFVASGQTILSRMWERIDSGSWVVPQVAVTLSIIDPKFMGQCRSRLEAHCPLDTTSLRSLTAIERHSAAGPAGGTERSAKAARSLSWLARRSTPQPAWLQPVLDSPEYQVLASQDIDSSDQITERWHQRITSILQSIQS